MDGGGIFLQRVTEKNRVYLCLLMVVFLWGVNSVSIKYLTQFFPPVLLAAVRLVLASAFLFIFFFCTNKKRLLPRASWAPTAGVSLFCIFLHQIALTTGLKETSGTHAILILGLGPLFTMIFAAVFLKEKIFLPQALGLLSGFLGVLLVVSGKSQSGSTLLGDGITAIAAITFSIGSLFVKKAVCNSSSLAVTTYSHLFAAGGLATSAAFLYTGADFPADLGILPVLVLLFSSFMSTAVGALLWNQSIHKAGASTASLFQNGSPVIGILASAAFLGEELLWQYFISLVLVVGGVILGTGIWKMPLRTAK